MSNNNNSNNSRFTGFPASNNRLSSSPNNRAPLPGGATRQTSARYGRDEEDDRLPTIRSQNYPPTPADVVGGGDATSNSRVSFSNEASNAGGSSSQLYGSRKSNRGSLEDDHPDVEGLAKQMETTGFGGSNSSSNNDIGSGFMGGAYNVRTSPSGGRSPNRAGLPPSMRTNHIAPLSNQNASGGNNRAHSAGSAYHSSASSVPRRAISTPHNDGVPPPFEEPQSPALTPSARNSTGLPPASSVAASVPAATSASAESKEEQDFQAALQQSVMGSAAGGTKKKKKNLVVLLTAQELEEARSFARELRSVCNAQTDVALVQNFLVLCHTTQGTVKKALEDAMKYDPSMVDLEELFTVNDILLDAIDRAEKTVAQADDRYHHEQGTQQHQGHHSSGSSHAVQSTAVSSSSSSSSASPQATMPPMSSSSSSAPHHPHNSSSSSNHRTQRVPSSHVASPGTLIRRQTTRSLEIDALVRKKDIFSLICMLRAQSDKRLDSALALMRFARMAERKGDIESMRLRNEIRSSGGMHSLLTLFRTKGTTRELKVVAALAVAYLLPPFVESSALTGPNLALKIVECLRYLFSSRPVSPKNEEITRSEMYNASAMGLTTFWINAFFPMLQQEGAAQLENSAEVGRRARGRGQVGNSNNSAGGSFDQRQETLEVQELLEIIVSLIVNMAKLSDSEINSGNSSNSSGGGLDDSKLSLRYTLVEQMCAVDVARPLAVREGLLKVLVGWMKSKDREKVRPAATSLRDLTSTLDKYMAGWIHSQIVNEGALGEIVELVVSASYGHDVRLAVAQILSSLCVAPHTRAAVVEAQCINYLIPLLWCEHSDPSSQQVAYAAGSALLQLAAGAMTRASVYDADNVDMNDAVSPDKRDKVINDIVNGGAIGPLVQMATSGERGKLRSMSIEALRVISEDTSPARLTRLQLCEDRAAEALGSVLKDDVTVAGRYLSNGRDLDAANFDKVPKDVVNELHQALCTLANMLDPTEAFAGQVSNYHSSRLKDAEKTLILGCIQIAKTGGLQSLLTLAFLPFTVESLSTAPDDVDAMDLLIEACRSLAALSPLLLSDLAAVDGFTGLALQVLGALTMILKRLSLAEDKDVEYPDVAYELKNDALRGLSALAKSEPLKIRIVDKSLPFLMQSKAARGDRNDVANTAAQVCLSLGFAEDELAVQVAGNDAKLLGDWFCMQRSLLIQAMAREEIRILLSQIWKDSIAQAKKKGLLQPKLTREVSGQSSSSSFDRSGSDTGDIIVDSGIDEFFENIGRDEDSAILRSSVLSQYERMYEENDSVRGDSSYPLMFARDMCDEDSAGLLSQHVYPLNDPTSEKDWVLGHQRTVRKGPKPGTNKLRYSEMIRVQQLLNSCIPSRLLQSEILPVFDLRPEASFNFRALVMPQRRYFSFRREGQLVQRLCDKQAADLDSDDVHWTLGFTNSSFAGEFSETLVQAMYRCPMIRGLSFTRTSDAKLARDTDKENDAEEGSGLLANLAGSLPPWVADLTYDNVLNNRAVKALAAILETMGKLSAGQQKTEFNRMSFAGSQTDSVGQKQGSFRLLGIRNSPHLDREVWFSFFDLLGRSKTPGSSPAPRPLASLRCLDLSGNDMGDEVCALVLDMVHSKESRCRLEQLDLSGNSIRQGVAVTKALRSYIELHRYNQSAGVKMTKRSWRSPLHTLNLSSNQLFAGGIALEVIALLKNNALSLKTLDLSYNDLEFEGYQFTEVMWGTLMKNTSLRELNLSGNNFNPETIDSILERVKNVDTESGLAFLRFAQNTPPLTDIQVAGIDAFESRSRSVALERFVSDKERIKNGENLDDPVIAERNPSLNITNWSEEDAASIMSEDNLTQSDSSQYARPGMELKPPAKGDNMITVLFSAPLVFHDEQRKLRPFAKLDFDMERELLWQCLKEASRDIELSFDNATHHRLLATMTKRCSCLHYSGHGHPTYLPLENGKGGPHWLEVNVLKDLIVQGGGAPFKFVFVSACHSGLAGETFASAGVPHVVCCQQESELKDTAALAFTRQFYLSLAVGHTVKESFDQGCKAVRATPNLRNAEREMKKFVLLPRDGNHDVPVFNARPIREWPKTGSNRHLKPNKAMRGKGLTRSRSLYFGGARSSELSVRNMMQEDPSPTPPQFFLGREVDMFHVLGAILNKRLVSVIGEPGVGRSSLVCAICHYVNERASTIMEVERIFFVKTKQGRGGDRCRLLIQSLFNKLVEAGKALLPPEMMQLDMEDLFEHVCRALKNTKALIVFDRTELLENNDEAQDFPMFLSTLFRETRTVRVLLTGRRPLGIPSIGGVVEHHYNLGGLNFANTVRLFANLCPHLHTPAERHQFFTRMIIDAHQADLMARDQNISERTKKWFEVLGNGMPAGAEKAAYSVPAEEVANLGKDE